MEANAGDSTKSGLFWFCYHTKIATFAWIKKNRRALLITFVGAIILLFFLRASYQPIIILIRRFCFPILAICLLVYFAKYCWQKNSRLTKWMLVLDILFLILLAFLGPSIYEYLSFYSRYTTLDTTELNSLPISDFERIQPLTSVYSLAHDAVTESESPINADFVRIGNDYRWAIAIEPAYALSRILHGIDHLFSLPGTAASPTFSAGNKISVKFETGEHLLLGRNSHTATIRSFSPFKYFNYEPSEVTYFTDNEGKWIQVISLIRWRGFFFPCPEFGGVQVIRQDEKHALGIFGLMLTGAGEWIAPEDISKYNFLRGQNILSQKVSRFIADSFRFQEGFFAALPGYHDGDVRVPTLELEVNPQPFVGVFQDANTQEKILYHYFALEPFDIEKQGLDTSLFIPADGRGAIYTFRHFKHGTALSGVSSIATKVMESRKDYDWERNRPVEHRPFIKIVDDKIRFYWLTTVVTARLGKEKGRFIAGAMPEVVITDAQYNIPTWVDPRDPSNWLSKIQNEMKKQYAGETP